MTYFYVSRRYFLYQQMVDDLSYYKVIAQGIHKENPTTVTVTPIRHFSPVFIYKFDLDLII